MLQVLPKDIVEYKRIMQGMVALRAIEQEIQVTRGNVVLGKTCSAQRAAF